MIPKTTRPINTFGNWLSAPFKSSRFTFIPNMQILLGIDPNSHLQLVVWGVLRRTCADADILRTQHKTMKRSIKTQYIIYTGINCIVGAK